MSNSQNKTTKPNAQTTQRRKEIAKKIYEDAGHDITRQQFQQEFENALTSESIDIPSDRAIRTYIKELGIVFSNSAKASTQYTAFDKLGLILQDKIQQIRFTTIKDNDLVLFRGKPISRQTFMKNVKIVTTERDNGNLDKHALVHLFIILTERGLEQYICDVFVNESDYILYTSVHDYCAEIVFELSKLQASANRAYHLIQKTKDVSKEEVDSDEEDVSNSEE